ncbi:hypothetical protein MRX96_023823 [Rhipicephalus microplus]
MHRGPIEHAPSFYNYRNKIAIPLVLASPEERISTSYCGCSSHHEFRIERDTVKFANYNGAAAITTALLARWLRHNAVF